MVRSLATPRMLAQLRSLQAQGLEESAAILVRRPPLAVFRPTGSYWESPLVLPPPRHQRTAAPSHNLAHVHVYTPAPLFLNCG